MTRLFAVRQPTSLVRCQGNHWRTGGLPAAWLPLIALLALTAVAGVSLVHRAGAQEKPKPRQGFDEATMAAWKKAGATVGWMGENDIGYLEFLTQADGLAAAVQSFRFARWQEKLLAGLPRPAVPFGLSFAETKVTDAGLKELADLESLQTLDLGITQVTGAGLKDLAGLKSLQTLDLGGTKVTDAGLKELAGLKSLQTLDLGGTKVTNAGLKELTGLKSLQTLHLGGTKATEAGAAELQKALPACGIRY
jgi:internalin A